jgi:hypothetical protein
MAERQGSLHRRIAEGNPLLKVSPCSGIFTQEEQGLPKGFMRLQAVQWVCLTLRQPEELFPQLPRGS